MARLPAYTSPGTIAVYHIIHSRGRRWTTSAELVTLTGRQQRHIAYCLARLQKVGIIECLKMWGGYRYRCQLPLPKSAEPIVAQFEVIGRVLKRA